MSGKKGKRKRPTNPAEQKVLQDHVKAGMGHAHGASTSHMPESNMNHNKERGNLPPLVDMGIQEFPYQTSWEEWDITNYMPAERVAGEVFNNSLVEFIFYATPGLPFLTGVAHGPSGKGIREAKMSGVQSFIDERERALASYQVAVDNERLGYVPSGDGEDDDGDGDSGKGGCGNCGGGCGGGLCPLPIKWEDPLEAPDVSDVFEYAGITSEYDARINKAYGTLAAQQHREFQNTLRSLGVAQMESNTGRVQIVSEHQEHE